MVCMQQGQMTFTFHSAGFSMPSYCRAATQCQRYRAGAHRLRLSSEPSVLLSPGTTVTGLAILHTTPYLSLFSQNHLRGQACS